MASRSKGKSTKMVTDHSATKWTLASLESSALTLFAVKEAATLSPISELKKAACTALEILRIIGTRENKSTYYSTCGSKDWSYLLWIVKENKEAYERLGDYSSGLIAVIWRSFKKAEVPEEWLSAEMRDILEDLTQYDQPSKPKSQLY
jgi:hypothetical protein